MMSVPLSSGLVELVVEVGLITKACIVVGSSTGAAAVLILMIVCGCLRGRRCFVVLDCAYGRGQIVMITDKLCFC